MIPEIDESNLTEGAILVKDRLIDTNQIACIVILANYLFLEIVGNGMLLIIIIYERFAMDPQKRFIYQQYATVFVLFQFDFSKCDFQHLHGLPTDFWYTRISK